MKCPDSYSEIGTPQSSRATRPFSHPSAAHASGVLTSSPQLKQGDSLIELRRIGESFQGGSRFIAPAYFAEGSPRCHG
jgi:hypothetical protein